jgi:hypothetical protein
MRVTADKLQKAAPVIAAAKMGLVHDMLDAWTFVKVDISRALEAHHDNLSHTRIQPAVALKTALDQMFKLVHCRVRRTTRKSSE